MTERPADDTPAPETEGALRDRVRRLEQRVARERAAREEAESIAERGMRELWLANQELEQRVAERTAELTRSLEAAAAAADAKEAFLGDLGHELATPLHVLSGQLELIDDSTLGDEDRSRLQTARDQAESLGRTLAALVELAAAAGATAPDDLVERVPAEWLDQLVGTWTRAAAGRAQLLTPTIAGQADVGVLADWARLQRIADALLANVVAHATAGSVRIELAVGDDVRLEIADPGPGIDGERLATITEPFIRSSGGSLGLGLALADRRANAVGGTLVIESRTGSGTTATVTLPSPG